MRTKIVRFRGISFGCRSLKTRFLWRMVQNWKMEMSSKSPQAYTCQQVLTSPNSPILSATINRQAVRQPAARLTCMIHSKHTMICMCVLLLMALLPPLLYCSYREPFPLLLLWFCFILVPKFFFLIYMFAFMTPTPVYSLSVAVDTRATSATYDFASTWVSACMDVLCQWVADACC